LDGDDAVMVEPDSAEDEAEELALAQSGGTRGCRYDHWADGSN
jgi:hypothetical protein